MPVPVPVTPGIRKPNTPKKQEEEAQRLPCEQRGSLVPIVKPLHTFITMLVEPEVNRCWALLILLM